MHVQSSPAHRSRCVRRARTGEFPATATPGLARAVTRLGPAANGWSAPSAAISALDTALVPPSPGPHPEHVDRVADDRAAAACAGIRSDAREATKGCGMRHRHRCAPARRWRAGPQRRSRRARTPNCPRSHSPGRCAPSPACSQISPRMLRGRRASSDARWNPAGLACGRIAAIDQIRETAAIQDPPA